MPTYVLLGCYTDQGIKAIGDTTKRADAAKELARKAGATMKEVYWVLGAYDIVSVVEAPDDETMTALSLSLSRQGNVKTQTLRAFSAGEMGKILGKLA
jgi:uncharacterized protein with GYD domain